MNLVGLSFYLVPISISSFRHWAWDAFPARSVVYVFVNILSLVNEIDKHIHLHDCLELFQLFGIGQGGGWD